MQDAYAQYRRYVGPLLGFSLCINLLTLAVPLYMLQVYDRVLTSRSLETLGLLTVIVVAALALLGALDILRSRITINLARAVDEILSRPVFDAVYEESRRMGTASTRPFEYQNAIFQFLTGNGIHAIFDAPWIPFFFIVLFLLHPIFALVGIVGAAVLILITLWAHARSREPSSEAGNHNAQAQEVVEPMVTNLDAVAAMGMRDALYERWVGRHNGWSAAQGQASTIILSAGGLTRTLRFVIQAAALCFGAILTIQNAITPGTMIAAVIIMGRVLAPVEQAIANWRPFQASQVAMRRLDSYFLSYGRAPVPAVEAEPNGQLTAETLAVTVPGGRKPVLTTPSFRVEPGQSVGLIGPNGAGKSSLLRVLAGIWEPANGIVRVNGADIASWPDSLRTRTFGYLPQEIQLLSGNVVETISRFTTPDPTEVVKAAKRAGAHRMILSMPNGYETEIGAQGARLSGGQRQRLGLARALYRSPPIVFLDEPNANLDDHGVASLVETLRILRSTGTTVFTITHSGRIVAEMDLLMYIRDGSIKAFGPRAQVLEWVAAQQSDPHP